MVSKSTIWDETYLTDKMSIRTFESSQLLEWHRDYEDRILTILEIFGSWEFHIDNQIPVILTSGQEIIICKDVWHRLHAKDIGQISILVQKVNNLT